MLDNKVVLHLVSLIAPSSAHTAETFSRETRETLKYAEAEAGSCLNGTEAAPVNHVTQFASGYFSIFYSSLSTYTHQTYSATNNFSMCMFVGELWTTTCAIESAE